MGLRENIWRDDMSRLALRPPVMVGPEATIRHTVALMQQASTGCALICEGEKLAGIFTERDLVKRVHVQGVSLDQPIRAVMTSHPVTLKPTDSVGCAIRTMHQGHYRHLPVVDAEGRPVGIVSVKGIIQYLVDHVPLAVYNLPPQPRQVQGSREGA